MLYYKLVNITINAQDLVEVIIDIIVHPHEVSKSIVIDQDLLLISKFWFLLYYFVKIKNNYLQFFTYKRIARLRNKTV